ncbi:MAG: S41 family peptidase [Bryobacteraceae bacterium]|nr:S41 family peptidase [Bryobacteraceae bacterium]
MRRIAATLLAFGLAAGAAMPQMTVDQRVHDFQNLAALYAKRYAPGEWKKYALGFDLFDLTPWLQRIRAATSDLEYYEICQEYVASLQDGHSGYSAATAGFVASLGFAVDIYDGKVLVEQINRQLLPSATYPFEVGDELVSVDGRTAEEWVTLYSRRISLGNPASSRRYAADRITFRPQVQVPRAAELGDTAEVVIRRASGEQQTFSIRWQKSGLPLLQAGPVPPVKGPLAASGEPAIRTFEAPPGLLFEGTTWSEETQQEEPRRYLLGWGARAPVFAGALPANFQQRLGRQPSEFHFSGTFTADGLRIGYIRIPSFSPPLSIAIRELETEVAFFEQNTDGLIVDVMRNPGGGCYITEAAARLIPYRFTGFAQQIRPTLNFVNSFAQLPQQLRAQRAEAWIIALVENYVDQMRTTYREGGLTGPIPACSQTGALVGASFEVDPAAVVYSKPLIVLTDEFSVSAADIFPSIIQDNRRGPIVGMRTAGMGGLAEGWNVGFYSEATAGNTLTLVTRPRYINTPDYPSAPYVENIGVRPDIEVNYMTRDNLMTGGGPFVERITQIMVQQIRAPR